MTASSDAIQQLGMPGVDASLVDITALDAARGMADGSISVRAYTEALIGRTAEREPQVQAFAWLDASHWRALADDADHRRANGTACGPLFGLPIGLKDIIDTADLPTENGTVLHAGRQPLADAELVRRLRMAGALVMGKTVTTELATYAPGKTRNPHNLEHTPGGSSSGSAAAVAAGMVPLAVGTQTGGSVIRPASFCGVVGYKPSFGWIPRSGVLQQSTSFDQVGVFGRSVEDVALLAQHLVGQDPGDPATQLQAQPPLLAVARQEPPLPSTLAFVRTPHWSRMDADAQAAFEELNALLAGRIAEFELPGSAASAVDLHRLVMEAEIAASFDDEYQRGGAQLSASLRGQIERGRDLSYGDHRRALDRLAVIGAALDTVFDHCDAILTPATLGAAPVGLASTGDSVMCVLWTATGLPAVTLPLLKSTNGLPIGVQLVGRRDDDARLLRTARWLVRQVWQQKPTDQRGPAT